MSSYREVFECQICGHRECHTITAYGDYDGPDEPYSLKNCVRCNTLKETVPTLFARMEKMAQKISDLEAAVAIYRKNQMLFYKEFMTQFGDHKIIPTEEYRNFSKSLDKIDDAAQEKLKKLKL